MKKWILFIIKLVKEVQKDDLIAKANELTYKLLLALFPFIIFLMTLLGFLNIDGNLFIKQMSEYMPKEIMGLIDVFVVEVINTRNVSLLSTSLFISIFAASSGFDSVIRGINQCYGCKETRNYFHVKLLSIVMVFIFTASIIFSLVLIIIDTNFISNIDPEHFPKLTSTFFGVVLLAVSIFVLLITVMLIYRLSGCKKIRFKSLLPGALFTVIIWVIGSKGFNIYIENFSRFSKVYGSLGSIVILMLWLNIISIVLLLGSEINALLDTETIEAKT